jgi:hypothetical protein
MMISTMIVIVRIMLHSIEYALFQLIYSLTGKQYQYKYKYIYIYYLYIVDQIKKKAKMKQIKIEI